MYQHQLVVSDGTHKTFHCGCGPKFFGRFGKSLVSLTVIIVLKYSIIRKDGHNILTLDDFSAYGQQPAIKIGNPTNLDTEPQAPKSATPPPLETPIHDIENTGPITVRGMVIAKSEIREYTFRLGIFSPYFHFNIEYATDKVNVSTYDNYTTLFDDIEVKK